jgi:hypothetical protein
VYTTHFYGIASVGSINGILNGKVTLVLSCVDYRLSKFKRQINLAEGTVFCSVGLAGNVDNDNPGPCRLDPFVVTKAPVFSFISVRRLEIQENYGIIIMYIAIK